MCIWTISVLVLAGLVFYFFEHRARKADQKAEITEIQAFEAKLVSASGLVLVRKPGRSEWQEVKSGARFKEGDLIRTDGSGTASIVDSNGTEVFIQENTIFRVQNTRGGTIEVTASPQMAMLEEKAPRSSVDSRNAIDGTMPGEGKTGELRPSIELQRIIPFGRSLELVGKVEAGSKLVVNDEDAEVSGDGSFKHFTNPFPASATRVSLVMRVTNLAGQTRVLRTTYAFRSPGGEY